MINFANTGKNLLKYWICAEFLLMESYAQGALRKAVLISTCMKRFKAITLVRSS